MTAEQRAKLRGLATAAHSAAPAPWRQHSYAAEVVDSEDEIIANCNMNGDRLTGGSSGNFCVSEFVAESNPAAVIALLDALHQSERLVATLQAVNGLYQITGDAMVARIAQLEALLAEARGWLVREHDNYQGGPIKAALHEICADIDERLDDTALAGSSSKEKG